MNQSQRTPTQIIGSLQWYVLVLTTTAATIKRKMIPPTPFASSAASSMSVGGGAGAAALYSCFVYGTLMSPEVLQTLLGRVPAMIQPAFLPNHTRHPVRDQVFPGVIPSSTSSTSSVSTDHQSQDYGNNDEFCSDGGVKGILLRGLTQEEMKVLDWFEDEEYQRRNVLVRAPKQERNTTLADATSLSLPSGGLESILTQAYIWTNPTSELDVTRDWSFELFRKTKLLWYLQHTVRPCREELNRLGIGRIE